MTVLPPNTPKTTAPVTTPAAIRSPVVITLSSYASLATVSTAGQDESYLDISMLVEVAAPGMHVAYTRARPLDIAHPASRAAD